jgi:hypothetical protein
VFDPLDKLRAEFHERTIPERVCNNLQSSRDDVHV